MDASQNGFGEPAAKSLSRTKHLRNLLILRLNYNQMRKPSLAVLAGSSLGKRLAVLEANDPDEIPF